MALPTGQSLSWGLLLQYTRAVTPQGIGDPALTVLVHEWLFPQGSHCPGVYYYTRAVTPQGTDCLGVYCYARAVTPQGTKDPTLTVIVHKWLFPQGNDCPEVYYYTRAVTPQETKDPALTIILPQYALPTGQ